MSEDEVEVGPALSKGEMKEVLHAMHIKTVSKKAVEEDAHFEAKVDRILSKIKDVEAVGETGNPELRVVLVAAMKQDEREVHAQVGWSGSRGCSTTRGHSTAPFLFLNTLFNWLWGGGILL